MADNRDIEKQQVGASEPGQSAIESADAESVRPDSQELPSDSSGEVQASAAESQDSIVADTYDSVADAQVPTAADSQVLADDVPVSAGDTQTPEGEVQAPTADPQAAAAAPAGPTPGKGDGKRARKGGGKGKAKRSRKGAKGKKAGKKRRGPKISTIIAVLILLVGIGIIAYPTFSDWWNSYHQSRAIASYVAAVQETDPEKIKAMLEEAHDYNERLLTKGNRYTMSDAEKKEYESILNLTGNGVMGYVQINSINVDYPIYHGMSESVLQIAIGHLEGTSLPVGGPNTHAAISGHRGLPSAKLFTDLDKLVEGDTFTVTVLDETVTYEIDQIRIVLPTDLSDLNIESGKDYCTLITCTPYGINTHRMLVRGHRIDNLADMDVVVPDALQIPRYIAIPAVSIPILFVFLIGMLIYYRVRRPELNKERMADALHDAVQKADEREGAAK